MESAHPTPGIIPTEAEMDDLVTFLDRAARKAREAAPDAAYLPQVDLIAMKYKYNMKIGVINDDSGWQFVEFA